MNFYVHDAILKNQLLYDLLNKICDNLLRVLNSGDYITAVDFVDTVHCLPDIIAENRFTIPKSYWKSHMKSYRKKWDKTFLVEEQRILK